MTTGRFPQTGRWPFVAGIHRSLVDIPSQKASIADNVRLNDLLNKQSNCWWFETPQRSCSIIVKQLYAPSITDHVWSWWRHQMETFSALLGFARGIHRSPVDSPHKGQWHGALMFSLMCASTNDRASNGDAGDLRPHGTHHDVTVIFLLCFVVFWHRSIYPHPSELLWYWLPKNNPKQNKQTKKTHDKTPNQVYSMA